jgi:hypothetical protein
VSNEARHRDIAALLARGVIRVKKQPLVAKAIESNMPMEPSYVADPSPDADSARKNNDHQSNASSVEPMRHGGDQ